MVKKLLLCIILIGLSTAPVSHAEPTDDLIEKYYNDILNRAPDPAGAQGWKNEIQRLVGLGIDVKEGFIAVAKFFFNSQEYLNFNSNDNAYVVSLYETFLDRSPAQSEVDGWVQVLQQGLSRELVFNGFAYSVEFRKFIQARLRTSSSGDPAANLVNDFYRGLLFRPPDTVGFDGWLAEMKTAQQTGPDAVRNLSHHIALGFINSQEYFTRNRTDQDFLKDLYDGILRRSASRAEFDSWLNIIRAGASREDVLRGFTDSPEFQDRVQEIINAATKGGGVSGIIVGVIEEFGSIRIRDRLLETEGTEVEIEGQKASFDDLKKGMHVEVESSLDDSGTSGKATLIRYNDKVEGPILEVTTSGDGTIKTLNVMGQTVVAEEGLTHFDNSDPAFTFAALTIANIGNVVEVSGFRDTLGTIQATFIERKAVDLASFFAAAGNDLEVEGIVQDLALSGMTFKIKNLTINASGIIPRNGILANGRLVEVKGDDLVNNILQAIDVEIKDGKLGDNIAKVEVEAFVADLNTTNQTFTLDGQTVSYAAATLIGGNIDDLVAGTKVEAEGPIVGGVLQAVKIRFKESIKLESNVETINAVSGTLTLEGINSLTVMVDPSLTEYKNTIGLNGIAFGNEVKIRGRISGSDPNTVIATRLELVDTDSGERTILQGPVSGFNEASGVVTILGIDVDITTIQNDDFKNEDTIIGRQAFFDALTVGALVKARQDLDTGFWDEIEFED